MSLTANGNATATPPIPKSPQRKFIIRAANLTDGPKVGRVAAKTYYPTPLSTFLAPYREKYYADWERGFAERATTRMLSPRNVTFVACPVDEPRKVVGGAQFVRLGDDAGARELIRSVGIVKRIFLWVSSWLFWVYCLVFSWLAGGDKSADKAAVKTFADWCRQDNEKYWDSHEERANRWHAQSVTVLDEWQGRGIGKRLMGEVIARAEKEGVIVGLESSTKGEGLYRKLGFELLGRFNEDQGDSLRGGGEENGVGGVMMWCPEGWKERVDENI